MKRGLVIPGFLLIYTRLINNTLVTYCFSS